MPAEHMNPDDGLWKEGTDPDPVIKRALSKMAAQIKKLTDPRPANRFAVFRIGYRQLIESIGILMGGLPQYAVRWVNCPWPDGARCVHIREDLWSQSFLLTMEHESFPETPEGAPFPILGDHLGRVQLEVVKLGKPEVE